MYRPPSRKKTKNAPQKLNLIPILDSVFIFIFFLLMSASFLKIYEIPSDVPVVSDSKPKKNEKPLALTLRITPSSIKIYTGVPSRYIKQIEKTPDGTYDIEGLHNYLISLKKKYRDEETVILEPTIDLEYADLVKIMDAARILRKTDPALYKKDQDGIDVRSYTLFSNIVFGNIQS